MFFGRSGYGYRSYSFPNPLYLLPSLERDYKYIIYIVSAGMRKRKVFRETVITVIVIGL